MLRVIEALAIDWRRLVERIGELSAEIEAVASADAGCDRLMSVPGLGPIIASPTVAAIGTGEVFSKGRDFAAGLGLVPRQNLYRRPNGPRQNIEARQSLFARAVRAGCLGGADQTDAAGNGMVSNPGSRPPRSGYTTTSSQSPLPTSLPIPWRCWQRAATSKLPGSMV